MIIINSVSSSANNIPEPTTVSADQSNITMIENLLLLVATQVMVPSFAFVAGENISTP